MKMHAPHQGDSSILWRWCVLWPRLRNS
jgi:hypothetical protein